MSEGFEKKEAEKCFRCRYWRRDTKSVSSFVYYCGVIWDTRGVLKEVDGGHECDVNMFRGVRWGESM